MKILYNKPTEIKEFDMGKFLESIHQYDNSVTREQVERELKDFPYDPLHYSCLKEIAIRLIGNENKAREYWANHRGTSQGFERLRRITGYLVGDLSRWNDGKKAEEKARVKHNVDGVYTQDEKLAREEQKRENLNDLQNEYHRQGTCSD